MHWVHGWHKPHLPTIEEIAWNAYQEQKTVEVSRQEASEVVSEVGAGAPGQVQEPPAKIAALTDGSLIELCNIGRFDGLQIVPPHPDSFPWERGSSDTGSHTLTYHGGPTVKTPKLFLIYVGFQGDIEPFAKDLMESGYLSGLGAYGSGNGTVIGKYVYGGSVPAVVDDALWIQPFLQWLQFMDYVPAPDFETMYALFFGPGTTVTIDGESSCSVFCGYHSALRDGKTLYLVLPDTSCGPCHGPNSPSDALQMVLSHEVAECATNPWGTGWYEDNTGEENGDICAWPNPPPKFGPWTVQGYYTNESGCTVGAYTPNQPPPPVPQPPPPSSDLEERLAKLERWQQDVSGFFREFPNA